MAEELVKIPTGALAPCAINCSACYLHLKKTNPCPGCWVQGHFKPEQCQVCKIKECVLEQGLDFCSECPSFPCTMLENLDKNYRKKFKSF